MWAVSCISRAHRASATTTRQLRLTPSPSSTSSPHSRRSRTHPSYRTLARRDIFPANKGPRCAVSQQSTARPKVNALAITAFPTAWRKAVQLPARQHGSTTHGPRRGPHGGLQETSFESQQQMSTKDQDNLQERSEQVAMTGQIYSQAADVRAWLGVGTERNLLAMHRLRKTDWPAISDDIHHVERFLCWQSFATIRELLNSGILVENMDHSRTLSSYEACGAVFRSNDQFKLPDPCKPSRTCDLRTHLCAM